MSQARQSFGPVRFIPGSNGGRYPSSNSLYLAGPKVLIDAGASRESLARLRREEGVSQVWLSHWHRDHIRHLDLFDDLPLYMAQDDAPALADVEANLAWSGVVRAPHRERWRKLLLESFNFRPRTPAGFLRPGQELDLPGVRVRVIGAPGHTPGSLCFLFEPGGVLFLADYDLIPFGPWYGDPHSDMDQIERTVAMLRQVPAQTWLASHGQGVFRQDPAQLWDNFTNVFAQRDRQLLRLLERPRLLEDIVDACLVYGHARQPAFFYRAAEAALMLKHLARLAARGLVRQEGGRYTRV